MNRTMIENDLNLSTDAASGMVAMNGIAVAALRRPHLVDGIVAMGWLQATGVVVQTADAGQAVHLANALGFPAGDHQAAFLLPRTGEISGVTVVIDTVQR